VYFFALLYYTLREIVTDECLTLLTQAIKANNITADNVYNWDEKGFLIIIMQIMKRIMSLEAYKLRRVRQAC